MHSYVRELKDLYRKGRITRREFLFYATTLGLSASAATAFLAACGAQPTPTPVSLPATPTRPAEAPATSAPEATKAPTATTAPVSTPTVASAVKRGGTLTWADRVEKVQLPWQMGWSPGERCLSQTMEHLINFDTEYKLTGCLAENWEASEDLMTWTFNLRKGVKFNTGKEMTSEDVAWNLVQMCNPEYGPSISSYFSLYLKPEGIEATDKYTVTLHCEKPEINVPYHLSGGTTFIVPKDWMGDWAKEPVGTGPFTISEYVMGERMVFKRRNDYWGVGIDGKPLPYLDELVATDYGDEVSASVAALGSKQTDLMPYVVVSSVKTVQGFPHVSVIDYRTAGCSIMRVRRDRPPFDNKDVRNALKAVQDRQQLLDNSYLGIGDIGYDTHVAPVQVDFCPEQPIPQDIAKSKALLSQAGYPDGIEVTMSIKTDLEWEATMAQVYKEQAAQAGIKVNLDVQPDTVFWDNWDKYDFAAVLWDGGYATGIQQMNNAYRCGVDWNETRMCDPEFDKMLDEASQTLDVEKRRQIMCKIQAYHRENGGVLNPFFTHQFAAWDKKVKGVDMNTYLFYFTRAWIES